MENVPDAGLPTHGGTTTSVMVTLDLDTLLTGIGTATTSTGDRITAEQARRLACGARIIPVVLGRNGEVLDLGRSAPAVLSGPTQGDDPNGSTSFHRRT
jgi:hypothetical protein